MFWVASQSDDDDDHDYLDLAASYGWNDFQHPGGNALRFVIEYECPSDPSTSQYCSRKSACLSSMLILDFNPVLVLT
jgi:hypothetical protein